jgi:hypothetical protein
VIECRNFMEVVTKEKFQSTSQCTHSSNENTVVEDFSSEQSNRDIANSLGKLM